MDLEPFVEMDNAFNQTHLTTVQPLPVHLDQPAEMEDAFKDQPIHVLMLDAHLDQLVKTVNAFLWTDAV